MGAINGIVLNTFKISTSIITYSANMRVAPKTRCAVSNVGTQDNPVPMRDQMTMGEAGMISFNYVFCRYSVAKST